MTEIPFKFSSFFYFKIYRQFFKGDTYKFHIVCESISFFLLFTQLLPQFNPYSYLMSLFLFFIHAVGGVVDSISYKAKIRRLVSKQQSDLVKIYRFPNPMPFMTFLIFAMFLQLSVNAILLLDFNIIRFFAFFFQAISYPTIFWYCDPDTPTLWEKIKEKVKSIRFAANLKPALVRI